MSTRKRRATSPKTKKPASTPPPAAAAGTTARDLASPEEPSVVRSIFQTKTSKKDGKQYLLKDSFPCFAKDDMWNIMLELGFMYRQGFRNPEWGIQTFDHEDELRQFMVRNGIPPNTHEVLEEKVHRDALKKWIAFAFVPLKTLEAPAILKKVAVPTDYQALSSLLKLGFKIDGKTGKIHREEEEFHSILELRNFVRMTDSDTLLSAATQDDDATPRKRARRSTRKDDGMLLSDEELLALRMWAALSPSLLPGEEAQIGEEEEEEEDNKARQPTEDSSSEESSDEEDSKKPTAVKGKKGKKQSAKKKGDEIEQSASEDVEMDATAATSTPAKAPSTAQGGFLTPEECSETDSDAANPSQGNSCIIL